MIMLTTLFASGRTGNFGAYVRGAFDHEPNTELVPTYDEPYVEDDAFVANNLQTWDDVATAVAKRISIRDANWRKRCKSQYPHIKAVRPASSRVVRRRPRAGIIERELWAGRVQIARDRLASALRGKDKAERTAARRELRFAEGKLWYAEKRLGLR